MGCCQKIVTQDIIMMLIYSGDEIGARTKKVILGCRRDEHRGVAGEDTLSEALWASLTRFKLLGIQVIG